MSRRGEFRLRTIARARDCVALGARLQTTHLLTGLSEAQLQNLFNDHGGMSLMGRTPDSAEWYFRSNLAQQVEASTVVALFVRLRSGGVEAADALIGAFRHYRLTLSDPRICFNRAFDLISRLEGRWLARTPALALLPCTVCCSLHLVPAGTRETSKKTCPFCKMRRRLDLRDRLAFTTPSSQERIASRLSFLSNHLFKSRSLTRGAALAGPDLTMEATHALAASRTHH